MDRFEVKVRDYILQAINHLHSSMDRFEAMLIIPLCLALPTLHSSMDRFEAKSFSTINRGVKDFTFQYG